MEDACNRLLALGKVLVHSRRGKRSLLSLHFCYFRSFFCLFGIIVCTRTLSFQVAMLATFELFSENMDAVSATWTCFGTVAKSIMCELFWHLWERAMSEVLRHTEYKKVHLSGACMSRFL